MLSFAARRLLSSVPTLLVLITLAFFMMRAAPGGPFDRERSLPPEIEAAMNSAYHLNDPLGSQYFRYMGGLLRGDLGPSFQYTGFSVRELIASGFPVSLQLGLWSMLLSLVLGCAAGMLAALRQNRPADHKVITPAHAGV